MIPGVLRGSLLAVLGLFIGASPARAQEVVKRVGQVTFRADLKTAFPGGLIVAHLQARGSLGSAFAILDGRRVPFFPAAAGRGLRALVPIPVGTPSGPRALGVEIIARRGRQRVPLQVSIGERAYPGRTIVLPAVQRGLQLLPASVRDGRRLLLALRSGSSGASPSLLLSPLAAAPAMGFGGAESFVGTAPFESVVDSIFGEYHRGLDYAVPVGTPFSAPASGTVSLAAPLRLSGQTLVIDHGQGVASAFYHLSRIDVMEGQLVESQQSLGLSGESGVAQAPHLHWGVYVHGVAVDPLVAMQVLE